MRESSVMMLSATPSEKYSCSGSPLILVNASTAIDGLSDKGRAGRFCIPSRTRNTWILLAMFFSSGVPRSTTSNAILPAASSRTRGRDTDAARFGQRLQPRRDVHRGAADPVALHHHLTGVQPDAEQ